MALLLKYIYIYKCNTKKRRDQHRRQQHGEQKENAPLSCPCANSKVFRAIRFLKQLLEPDRVATCAKKSAQNGQSCHDRLKKILSTYALDVLLIEQKTNFADA